MYDMVNKLRDHFNLAKTHPRINNRYLIQFRVDTYVLMGSVNRLDATRGKGHKVQVI